jgi:Na+/melibiose symporter-like transporter
VHNSFSAPQPQLRRAKLAAFVAPCLPLAALSLPLVVYLPPHYASTLGLEIGMVGVLFFLVRLIDLPIDPLIGLAMDRAPSGLGRFRPWLLGGSVLLLVGIALVFFAAPGISAARAFAGLLILNLGLSAMLVAHAAWGAVLSDDYHERSRIFGWWQTANLFGMLGILAVPPLAASLGFGPSSTVPAIGAVIAFLLVPVLVWTLRAVPERPSRTARPRAHSVAALAGLVKLPLFRRMLIIDLLANLGPGVAGALVLFFLEAARGYSKTQTSVLLLLYFLAGLLAAPLWMGLARRTSKHRALSIAMLSYAVFQLGTIAIPRGNFPLAAFSIMLAGLPYAAPLFLLRAMLADLSDAETLRTGQEQTGLFYSALVAVQKFSYAIPVGLAYPLLTLLGFQASAGAANTPLALSALTVLFVVPPALLGLAASGLVHHWPITPANYSRTAAALREI